VQWHPEERLDDLRLFAGVVHAAAEYAYGKGPLLTTIDTDQPATEEELRTVELLDVPAADDAIARAKVRAEAMGPSWAPASGRRTCDRSPPWWMSHDPRAGKPRGVELPDT